MEDKALLDALRSIVKEEVGAVRQEMNGKFDELNGRIDSLEQGMGKLKADVAHFNHKSIPKIDAIYDGFKEMQVIPPRLEKVESRVDTLEDDVFALKQAK